MVKKLLMRSFCIFVSNLRVLHQVYCLVPLPYDLEVLN